MTDPLWRVHVRQLFEEVLANPNMWALRQPPGILDSLLRAVATRASELGDPELNRLMVQLTLYSIADPTSPDHAPAVVNAMLYPPENTA